jgi:hypothetical protein
MCRQPCGFEMLSTFSFLFSSKETGNVKQKEAPKGQFTVSEIAPAT